MRQTYPLVVFALPVQALGKKVTCHNFDDECCVGRVADAGADPGRVVERVA